MPTVDSMVALVQQALQEHGFGAHSVKPDSVVLVQTVLDAYIKARREKERLVTATERHVAALSVAEAQAPPLRAEIGRLTRENADLHAQLIAQAEAAEDAKKASDVELANGRGQIQDLSFLCSSLRTAVSNLEAENAGLREIVSRNFEHNGIMLPSGHEVRWHGRKERMEAHSPVMPTAATITMKGGPQAAGSSATVPLGGANASSVGEAAQRPPANNMVAADEAARLVRAAEAQLSALLRRVEESDPHMRELEAKLVEANERIARRDTEILRLGAQLSEARAEGGAADERRCEREAASLAIAQMSSQVDFLNERCVALEAELRTEAQATREARLAGDERSQLLQAIAQLRHEKGLMHAELEQVATLSRSLSAARPGALAPFGEAAA